MKQGGTTANTNSKKGMQHDKKCSICGRRYAMEWAKIGHERGCKEFNSIKTIMEGEK